MTREEMRHILRNIVSQEIMHNEYEAIEAACKELKSGEWEHDNKLDFYRCSICQHYVVRKYPYCMYCGAKMEEEK